MYACIYQLFGICQHAAILKYLSVTTLCKSVAEFFSFLFVCLFVFYKVAKFSGLCFDYLGGGVLLLYQ